MTNIKKSFDEGLENLEKGAVAQVKATVKAVVGQVGAGQGSQPQQASSDSGTNESTSASPVADANAALPSQQQSNQQTQEVVNAMYASSNPNKQHGLSPKTDSGKEQKEPSEFFKKQIDDGKTPEEAAKIEAIRNQLHKTDYYDPLVNRKPVGQEHKEEEQEKEEEKMEELQVEDNKKKQDDDIALRQAQQKTEKFPGASG